MHRQRDRSADDPTSHAQSDGKSDESDESDESDGSDGSDGSVNG